MATVQEFFEKLPTAVDASQDRGDAQLVRVRRAGVGAWTYASPTAPSPSPKGAEDADCTISASEETLIAHHHRRAEPDHRVHDGEAQDRGDMGAALKLQKLF